MHLLRIQVPDFRVLKDVDLRFEQEFTPKIFPLGSQNGGGKSTLLQLIFVLLHCSTNPDRLPALKSMLNGFKVYNNTSRRTLAIISIYDNDKSVELEFFSCEDSYINYLLHLEGVGESQEPERLMFSTILKLEYLKEGFSAFSRQQSELEEIVVEAEQMERLRNEYKRRQTELVLLSRNVDTILGYLQSRNLVYICNYSSDINENEDEALLCQVRNLEIEEVKPFLNNLSEKVFLAAPSTQVFLFLSQDTRKLLFKEQDKQLSSDTYYSHLKKASSKLPGLFTYDFLAVDLLINSFKAARDRDFREAIEVGEYGSSYKILLNDLNSMLASKQISLKSDLSGITFKMDRGDETIELYPEDLSHGELKRLSIYTWLKYRNVEDSLVLMDEIELALHPDWQYRIVSDLMQWAPSNQYILATHSYELCQALTPSHVKELEPKLLKQS